MEEKFRISFANMDPTEPLRLYALEKFTKHAHLIDHVMNADITLTQNKTHKGVSKDFKLTINITVPNGAVYVEERGEDMYAVIDSASDIMARRLKRYHEKLSQWEGTLPWNVAEIDEVVEDLEVDEIPVANFADYIPTIVERRKMEYMSPMAEAEAIERMELLDRDQILFKNSSTGNIAMIYRRRRGGYGIVEPDGV